MYKKQIAIHRLLLSRFVGCCGLHSSMVCAQIFHVHSRWNREHQAQPVTRLSACDQMQNCSPTHSTWTLTAKQCESTAIGGHKLVCNAGRSDRVQTDMPTSSSASLPNAHINKKTCTVRSVLSTESFWYIKSVSGIWPFQCIWYVCQGTPVFLLCLQYTGNTFSIQWVIVSST